MRFKTTSVCVQFFGYISFYQKVQSKFNLSLSKLPIFTHNKYTKFIFLSWRNHGSYSTQLHSSCYVNLPSVNKSWKQQVCGKMLCHYIRSCCLILMMICTVLIFQVWICNTDHTNISTHALNKQNS